MTVPNRDICNSPNIMYMYTGTVEYSPPAHHSLLGPFTRLSNHAADHVKIVAAHSMIVFRSMDWLKYCYRLSWLPCLLA